MKILFLFFHKIINISLLSHTSYEFVPSDQVTDEINSQKQVISIGNKRETNSCFLPPIKMCKILFLIKSFKLEWLWWMLLPMKISYYFILFTFYSLYYLLKRDKFSRTIILFLLHINTSMEIWMRKKMPSRYWFM